MSNLFASEIPAGTADRGNPRVAEAERLRQEHQELKSRLNELNARVYLSPSEELERKTLQKLKLATKDRIAALTVAYSGHS